MSPKPDPAQPEKKPKQRADVYLAAALAKQLTTIDARMATARQMLTDGENARKAIISNASPAVRAMAEAIRGATAKPDPAP